MIYPYNVANVQSFLTLVDGVISRAPENGAYIRDLLVRQPFFGRAGVEFAETEVLVLNDGYIGGALVQGGIRDNEIHFAAVEAAHEVKLSLPHRNIQVQSTSVMQEGVSERYWDRLYHNGNVPLWVPRLRSEDIVNHLLFGTALTPWASAVAGALYPGDDYITAGVKYSQSAFAAVLTRHVGVPGTVFVTASNETLNLNSDQPTSISPVPETPLAQAQMEAHFRTLKAWLNTGMTTAQKNQFKTNGWYERLERLLKAVYLNNYYWCQRIAVTGKP